MWRSLLVAALCLLVHSDVAAAMARVQSYREPGGACRYVYEQFKVDPDPWQQQVLTAFEDPRPEFKRIAMKACAGPGKTAVESWCGWYFLSTQCLREGEHPKGIATSVTSDNLRDNLWAEFSKWQVRSPWLSHSFSWTATRIYANDHPQTWFLTARNWPKAGSADEQGKTLSGIHSWSVLFLIDESGGIPATVLRAAEQGLTNTGFGKALQGGNPISLESMLYEACTRLREQWYVITITGDPEDANAWVNVPRVLELHREGDPHCECPRCWASKQIASYGRENPWVKAYILGEFPPASINALLGVEDVEKAMRRVIKPDAFERIQKKLGVDVARFGDDRTVIFPRQGLQAFNPVIMRNVDTNAIVARVMMAREKWGADAVFIDNSFAWGNGVVDNLRNMHVHPYAIDFGSPSSNPLYENLRAQMWIEMAAHIRDSGAGLPDLFPELVAELTTPTYTFSKNGKFLLEPKDQIKKRLGRSPDLADALALTYALPDMPRQWHRLVGAHGADGRALTDYDPMARG